MVRSVRRNIVRTVGERKGTKPSKYLHEMWEKLQIKKWGVRGRIAHLIHGSKPKRVWSQRYARVTGM